MPLTTFAPHAPTCGRPSRWLARGLVLAACLPLAGVTASCTTASAIALQPTKVEVQRPLNGTVRVEATGSARRAGIGSRAIGSDDLAHAVRGTLLASALSSGVVEGGEADHLLRVEVLSVERSDLQLDMQAAISVRWTLLDGAGRVARWEETVTTLGKATTFDAGMVEDRARMALESATRKNIEEGLRRLGRRAGDI
ncbi:MAG: hypothetical protein R3F49_01340 [Planctomycetota bacterium]